MPMEQRTKNRTRHLPVLFVVLGLIFFLNLFSSTDYRFFAVVVNLKVLVGGTAQTRLVLPPVGEVRARTHWLPVRISAELRSVELGALRQTVFSPQFQADQVLNQVQAAASRIIFHFLLKLVLLAFLGAMTGLLLLGVRSGRKLLQGGLLGILVVLTAAGLIYITYEPDAFQEVEYEGMI